MNYFLDWQLSREQNPVTWASKMETYKRHLNIISRPKKTHYKSKLNYSFNNYHELMYDIGYCSFMRMQISGGGRVLTSDTEMQPERRVTEQIK